MCSASYSPTSRRVGIAGQVLLPRLSPERNQGGDQSDAPSPCPTGNNCKIALGYFLKLRMYPFLDGLADASKTGRISA